MLTYLGMVAKANTYSEKLSTAQRDEQAGPWFMGIGMSKSCPVALYYRCPLRKRQTKGSLVKR